MTRTVLRIATRGSPLALAQANEVRGRLIASFPELGEPDAVQILPIKTTGDKLLDRTLEDAGGKGLFTKEIEEALLDRSADLAVHSMKDVPTALPPGLDMAALLPREDPRDAWFCPTGPGIDALPSESVVGTASLRRGAQILNRRPDLRVVPLRGNVQTRLGKLAAGEVHATLLALAGLNRLGLSDQATAILSPEEMLPAVAQGAIGIEIRSEDTRTRGYVAALACPMTEVRVAAERALLEALDGSCRTPIAALAELTEGDRLTLSGLVLSPDGRRVARGSRAGPAADARAMGLDLGAELRAAGVLG